MAGGNEVRVDIVGNDKLSDDIAKVIAQLEALKDKTIEVKINTKVDRNALKKDINSAVDGINRGQGRTALQLKVNRTEFAKSVKNAVGDAVDQVNKKGLDIDANTAKATAKIAALEKAIQGLNDKKVTINVDTDRAMAQVGTIVDAVEALNGRTVEIDVRANKRHLADDINDAVREFNGRDKNIKAQVGINKNVFNQEVNKAAKGFNDQVMHKDGVHIKTHLDVDESSLDKALRDRKINVTVHQSVLRTAINDAIGDHNRIVNVIINRQVLGDSLDKLLNKKRTIQLDVDGTAFERNLNRILQKTYHVRAQVDKAGIRDLFDNETILVRVGVMGLRESINNIIKVKRRMKVDLDQAEFDRALQRTLKKTYSVRVRVDKKAIKGLFDNEKITVDVVGNQKTLRDSLNKVLQTKRRVPIDVDGTAFNQNLQRLLNKTYDVKARVNKKGIKDLFANEVILIHVVANQKTLRDSINKVVQGQNGSRVFRIKVDADTSQLRSNVTNALQKVIKVHVKATKIDTSKISPVHIPGIINTGGAGGNGGANKQGKQLGNTMGESLSDEMNRVVRQRLWNQNSAMKNLGRQAISDLTRGMIANRNTGMDLDRLFDVDRKAVEKYIKKVLKGKIDIDVPVNANAKVGSVNQAELNRQLRQIIDNADHYIDRDRRRRNAPMFGDDFFPTRMLNRFTRGAAAFSGFMGKFTRSIPVVGAVFRAMAKVPALAGAIGGAFEKAGSALGAFASAHNVKGLGAIAKMLPMLGKVAGPVGAAAAAIGVAAVGLNALGALGVVGTAAITAGVYAWVGAMGAVVGISSVVSAAVGAGLIAPFAYFAAQLPEVKAAWEDLGNSLETQMTDISKRAAPGMTKMATELGKAFQHVKPQIEGMADMAGSALSNLADRVPPIANALGEAMPQMMKAGIDQLDLLASRMPNITRSLGDLFGSMNTPTMLTAAQNFYDKLPGTISAIQSALQGAGNSFNQSLNFLESPQLEPFFEGFRNLKEEFTNTNWSSATEGLKGAMNSLGNFVGNIDGETVSNMIGSLADGFGRLTDLANNADLVGTLDSIAAAFNGFATGLNMAVDLSGLDTIIQTTNKLIDLAGEIPGGLKRIFNIDGAGDAAESIDAANSALDRMIDKAGGADSAYGSVLEDISKSFNSIGNQSPAVAEGFKKMFDQLEYSSKNLDAESLTKAFENTKATVELVPDVSMDALKTGVMELNASIMVADVKDIKGLQDSQRQLLVDVIPRMDESAAVNFSEALSKAAKVSPQVDTAGMDAFRAAFDKVSMTAVTTAFSKEAQQHLGSSMQIYADILPRLNTAQIQSMGEAYTLSMNIAPKLDQTELNAQALALDNITASIRTTFESGDLAAAQSQIDAMNLTAKIAAQVESVEAHTNLYDNATIAIKAIPEIQAVNNAELDGLFNQAITQTIQVIPQVQGLDAQQALLNGLGTMVTVDVLPKIQTGDIAGAIASLNSYIATIPTQFGPPPAPPSTEGLPPAEVPTEYGEPTNSPPSGEETGAKATIPVEWGTPSGGPTIPPITPAQIPVDWGAVPATPSIPAIAAQQIPVEWGAVPGAPAISAIPPQQIPTQWAPVPGLPAVPAIPPATIPVQWGAVVGLPAIPPIPTQIIPVEWGTPSGSPPTGGGRFMGGSGSYGIGGFTGEAGSSSGLRNSAGIAGYEALRNHIVNSVRALEDDVKRELGELGKRATDALGIGMADGLRKQAPHIREGMGEIQNVIKGESKKIDAEGNKIRYQKEWIPHELGGGMGTWKSTIIRDSESTANAIKSGGDKIAGASKDAGSKISKATGEANAETQKATKARETALKSLMVDLPSAWGADSAQMDQIRKMALHNKKINKLFDDMSQGIGRGAYESDQAYQSAMRDRLNKLVADTNAMIGDAGKKVDSQQLWDALSGDGSFSMSFSSGGGAGGKAKSMAEKTSGEMNEAGKQVNKAGEDAARDIEDGVAKIEDAASDAEGLQAPSIDMTPNVTGLEQFAQIRGSIEGELGGLSGKAQFEISVAPIQIPPITLPPAIPPIQIPTMILPPMIPPMPQLPPVVQNVIANIEGALQDLGMIPEEVQTEAKTDTNADQAMSEIMALEGANTSSTHTIRVVTQGDSKGGGGRGGFIGGFGMAGIAGTSSAYSGLSGAAGLTTAFKLNVSEAQSILTISNAVQSSVLSSWQSLGTKIGERLQAGLNHWKGIVTEWWNRIFNRGKSPVTGATGPTISVFEDGKLVAKEFAEGIRDGDKIIVKAVGDLEGKIEDAIFHLPKVAERSMQSAFQLTSIGTSGISFKFNLSDIFDVFKKQQMQMSAGYLNEFGQFVVYNITDNSKIENRFDGGLVGDPERQAKTVLDIIGESRAGRSRLSQMVNGGA